MNDKTNKEMESIGLLNKSQLTLYCVSAKLLFRNLS